MVNGMWTFEERNKILVTNHHWPCDGSTWWLNRWPGLRTEHCLLVFSEIELDPFNKHLFCKRKYLDVSNKGKQKANGIFEKKNYFRYININMDTPSIPLMYKYHTLKVLKVATFWIRTPSKIKSLRTLNTRSRHVFLIAIPVLLPPQSSITNQVCSNSTFSLFSRIPHLATALIHNFYTLHVATQWQMFSI